ncbi:MAG: hypothetical protein HY670_03905 [Chloroflexi bacterium]|nr:hypothetical protein [Chloroflexota bacterium]
MTQQIVIMMVIGGVFILLGIGGLFWGRTEERKYFENVARRFDVREYVERSPFRPEPGALKIGGWIIIAVGIVLLGLAGFFLLSG